MNIGQEDLDEVPYHRGKNVTGYEQGDKKRSVMYVNIARHCIHVVMDCYHLLLGPCCKKPTRSGDNEPVATERTCRNPLVMMLFGIFQILTYFLG